MLIKIEQSLPQQLTTSPAQRNASIVFALKVTGIVTLWTKLWMRLVTIIATIIFAIAEEPAWDATIVVTRWTLLPAGATISVPTQVSRFVRVVAAVIVKVAVPQLGNALAVVAAILRVLVALSMMAELRVFVRAIRAVVVAYWKRLVL